MSQRDRLDLWWRDLDELTRRRVLKLRPEDALPDDVASDLQMHGITVVDAGPLQDEDGELVHLWVQPEILLDVVADHRSTPR